MNSTFVALLSLFIVCLTRWTVFDHCSCLRVFIVFSLHDDVCRLRVRLCSIVKCVKLFEQKTGYPVVHHFPNHFATMWKLFGIMSKLSSVFSRRDGHFLSTNRSMDWCKYIYESHDNSSEVFRRSDEANLRTLCPLFRVLPFFSVPVFSLLFWKKFQPLRRRLSIIRLKTKNSTFGNFVLFLEVNFAWPTDHLVTYHSFMRLMSQMRFWFKAIQKCYSNDLLRYRLYKLERLPMMDDRTVMYIGYAWIALRVARRCALDKSCEKEAASRSTSNSSLVNPNNFEITSTCHGKCSLVGNTVVKI